MTDLLPESRNRESRTLTTLSGLDLLDEGQSPPIHYEHI